MNKLFYTLLFITTIWSCTTERPQVILTLGDSNGAAKHGWVNQLASLRPSDSIYNKSISGNTIGFNNLDNPKLNTLENLDRYLHDVDQKAGKIDYVIIMLGTNDSKAVFDGRQHEVMNNLATLVQRVKAFEYTNTTDPKIVVLSPPPYGPDSLLAKKYKGGAARVKWLASQYSGTCRSLGAAFIDIHSHLENLFMDHSKDGVHLDAAGQMLIAEKINEYLEGRD